MVLDYLASRARRPFVGEVKLVNGSTSMCVSSLQVYGGGAGPLWMTENTSVQFTTRNHPSYLQGICRRVVPKDKAVVIEITHGNTWGRLASGTVVRIACSDLRRVHLSCEEGSHLLLHSQRFASHYRAKMAFRDISVKELERAIAQDASEQMARHWGQRFISGCTASAVCICAYAARLPASPIRR